MAGWRKRELQSERLYRMSGVSFKFLAKCSSAHLWWETPPARESIIKIQQGRQFPKLTYGLEEITFSSARGKRCLNTWGIRHNTQKGLFWFFCKSLHRIGIILSLSVWKKNSSETIHDLCLEFPFRESFCCLLGFQLP